MNRAELKPSDCNWYVVEQNPYPATDDAAVVAGPYWYPESAHAARSEALAASPARYLYVERRP